MGKNSLDNKNMPYKFRYMGNDILVPTTQELNNHIHSWDDLVDKPSSFNPSNHNHNYATWLGTQYASDEEWMGWYDKYQGIRKGWIGHADGNYLNIVNEYSNDGVKLKVNDAELRLDYTTTNPYIGYFYPRPTSKITLGTTTYRWYRLYQSQSSIDTSDERYKQDIKEFDVRYENFFMSLKPIRYKWKNILNNDHHDRVHGGFIAQWVKKALYDNNLSEMDFGFYCYDNLSENKELPFNDLHSLAYTEMIPLNTHMIQKLYKKVNQQQKEIDELKSKVNKMVELMRK